MTFLTANISVLAVIVPLMAAPICVIIRHSALAWAWATTIAGITFALSIGLLNQIIQNGTLVYKMGDWDGPWGIVYHIDELGAFVVLIVAAIAAIVNFSIRQCWRIQSTPTGRYFALAPPPLWS